MILLHYICISVFPFCFSDGNLPLSLEAIGKVDASACNPSLPFNEIAVYQKKKKMVFNLIVLKL